MVEPVQLFSEQALDTLDAWLRRRPVGLFDIVTLEGFLTAIVIGPNAISPVQWLPKVWGGRAPKFRDLDELNRFTALVMAYHNHIAVHFETDPTHFAPTFYQNKVGRKTILIVDEWCEGFMKGVRLDAKAWKPLERERPQLLKPIRLFGTRAGWRELKAGGEVAMHATWSVRVAPAVRDIYSYWLPFRRAQIVADSPSVRTH